MGQAKDERTTAVRPEFLLLDPQVVAEWAGVDEGVAQPYPRTYKK
jgi:hypothetical protein